MSRARLERIAVHHLERHPSSVANLRRVLARRAERSRTAVGGDAAEHAAWIEDVLARLARVGLLDDRAYAAAVTRRLRARGGSTRRIAARLAGAGVPGELVGAVLEGETGSAAAADGWAEDGAIGDPEHRAAAAYVKRRRLGPHRDSAAARAEHRARDLAALARAGFAYDVARAALQCPD